MDPGEPGLSSTDGADAEPGRLEVRDLVYFAAVAEELHFGRAATRLSIAQPPLSRAIARVERRVGTPLLERRHRRVELTAAGVVLLGAARSILESLDGAVHRARQAGRSDRLVLAVRPGTVSGLVAEVLRAFGEHRGGVQVDVVFERDLPSALRSGVADVAIVGSHEDLTGLCVEAVAQEREMALLPVDHALAARSSVTLAELRAVPSFRDPAPDAPLDEIVDRVALGLLSVVVGEGEVDRIGSRVVAVVVADRPRRPVLVAWSPEIPISSRDAFLRAARPLRPLSSGDR